jgi:hypothetical protein
MTSRLLVGTRKGLFLLERAPQGGPSWRIARTAFLGDPVTSVLAIPGTDRRYAALDHGHFGVKLHRSDDGGEHWEEIEAPAYPPKPDGVEDLDPFSQLPIPGRALVRHHARRALPHDQRRQRVGVGSPALGPPRSPAVGRRRIGLARHTLGARRPARP